MYTVWRHTKRINFLLHSLFLWRSIIKYKAYTENYPNDIKIIVHIKNIVLYINMNNYLHNCISSWDKCLVKVICARISLTTYVENLRVKLLPTISPPPLHKKKGWKSLKTNVFFLETWFLFPICRAPVCILYLISYFLPFFYAKSKGCYKYKSYFL